MISQHWMWLHMHRAWTAVSWVRVLCLSRPIALRGHSYYIIWLAPSLRQSATFLGRTALLVCRFAVQCQSKHAQCNSVGNHIETALKTVWTDIRKIAASMDDDFHLEAIFTQLFGTEYWIILSIYFLFARSFIAGPFNSLHSRTPRLSNALLLTSWSARLWI